MPIYHPMNSSLKIVYIANTRLPTEKAHGLATMKLCEAFAKGGASVDLIVPRYWRKIADPFSFYGVASVFSVKRLFTLDFMAFYLWEPLAFLIQMLSFSSIGSIYVSLKYSKENTIFISHDYMPLYFVSLTGYKVYYDIHHYPGRNFMYRHLLRHAFGFAVQTKWKARRLQEDFALGSAVIVYWPNGTDLSLYENAPTKTESREKFGVPLERRMALYAGQLFSWKGVDTLIQSVSYLPRDVWIYIVGGGDKEREELKKRVPESLNERIVFVGFVNPTLVSFWLSAADVLVLPNTGSAKVSLYYTSPMKLFEYMASSRPIVASRIPSISEVVTDREGFFAEADDARSFAKTIETVLTNEEEAQKRAEQSHEAAQNYTWEKRAVKIMDHMKMLQNF